MRFEDLQGMSVIPQSIGMYAYRTVNASQVVVVDESHITISCLLQGFNYNLIITQRTHSPPKYIVTEHEEDPGTWYSQTKVTNRKVGVLYVGIIGDTYEFQLCVGFGFRTVPACIWGRSCLSSEPWPHPKDANNTEPSHKYALIFK